MNRNQIIYTKTDEAPMLATHSLLPILNAFISKADRVLSAFPEYLKEDQQVEDSLGLLAELVKKPNANIIKLPNISASIPQLIATIEELQSKGYNIPSYPKLASDNKQKEIQLRYNKIKTYLEYKNHNCFNRSLVFSK